MTVVPNGLYLPLDYFSVTTWGSCLWQLVAFCAIISLVWSGALVTAGAASLDKALTLNLETKGCFEGSARYAAIVDHAKQPVVAFSKTFVFSSFISLENCPGKSNVVPIDDTFRYPAIEGFAVLWIRYDDEVSRRIDDRCLRFNAEIVEKTDIRRFLFGDSRGAEHMRNYGRSPAVIRNIHERSWKSNCCWAFHPIAQISGHGVLIETGEYVRTPARFVELLGGNSSLRIHNTGLPVINGVLKIGDSNERGGQNYLNEVREFKIKKTLFARGLPIALGWLIISSIAWLWLAKIAHDRQSALLTITAVVVLVSSIPIFFVILLWSDGYFSENASTALGNDASATRYRSTENVGVFSIVVAELKLSDVQRQVLFADLVESAHDATFQQRPKTIDGLSVNRADDVFVESVPNEGVRKIFAEVPIAASVIGRQQADLVGYGFTNETFQSVGIGMFNNPRHHVALALYGANDGYLAGACAARTAATLIPMLVAGLSRRYRFRPLLRRQRASQACVR